MLTQPFFQWESFLLYIFYYYFNSICANFIFRNSWFFMISLSILCLPYWSTWLLPCLSLRSFPCILKEPLNFLFVMTDAIFSVSFIFSSFQTDFKNILLFPLTGHFPKYTFHLYLQGNGPLLSCGRNFPKLYVFVWVFIFTKESYPVPLFWWVNCKYFP